MLPFIHKMQDRLRRSTIFTKLDLRSVYSQIQIKKREKQKTVFQTHYRHYKYCMMLQRLTNTLVAQQRFINNMLREYFDMFVLVYLDNILIYSQHKEKHVQHVRKVLQKLKQYNLQIELDKYNQHITKIGFLRYVITIEEVEIDLEKVKVVLNQLIPTNIREV